MFRVKDLIAEIASSRELITADAFNRATVKIKKKCKLISYRLVFNNRKTVLGRCSYYHSTIEISRLFKRHVQLAVALHELGHAIDDDSPSAVYWNTQARKSKLTDEKKQLLVEKLAWIYGERFADSAGIKLGPWFYLIKRLALDTYK